MSSLQCTPFSTAYSVQAGPAQCQGPICASSALIKHAPLDYMWLSLTSCSHSLGVTKANCDRPLSLVDELLIHALELCRFTTAALEVQDSAEAQRAQAILRRCGGRRFTASTVNLLHGVDKSKILALCPCSLTKHKLAQLQSWGDFTMGRSPKALQCHYILLSVNVPVPKDMSVVCL